MNYNHKVSLVTLILILVLINKLFSQEKGVDFQENPNWNNILLKAKTEHKLIFVDIYASWCGPCKAMDKNVYNNDTVGTYLNSNFISLKIQADSSKNDPKEIKSLYQLASQLIKTYNISQYPTFLFFDSDANLIHKEQGYNSPKQFIEICKTAADSTSNLKSEIDKYKRGQLIGTSLLKYALKLKQFKDDSMAITAAREFKKKEIEKHAPAEVLNSQTKQFFAKFTDLFNRKDPIIQYIFTHRQTSDSLVNQKGFSQALVELIAVRDIVNPEILQASQHNANALQWDSLEKKVTDSWDNEIAHQTILNKKIEWYSVHEKWDSLIKYRIIQIDHQIGQMNGKFRSLDAFYINNFVWDVILRRSEDQYSLKKACDYMHSITMSYPEDFQAMDTYANVLYKAGQKEKAIATEKKALAMAKEKKVGESIQLYIETIKRMELNKLNWE